MDTKICRETVFLPKDILFSALLIIPLFGQPCCLGGVPLGQAEVEDLVHLDALKHSHLIDNTLEVLLNAIGSIIQNWHEPSSGWWRRMKRQGQEQSGSIKGL